LVGSRRRACCVGRQKKTDAGSATVSSHSRAAVWWTCFESAGASQTFCRRAS
jgi:hypothetical protein